MKHLYSFALLALAATACMAHEDLPWVEQLASTPGRAAWEPLPLLTGQRQWLSVARRGLEDPNPVIRRRALFVIGCTGLPEGHALALGKLSDADRAVRMQAAVALAVLGDVRGLDGATVALQEGPPWLRLYALQGLWRLDQPVARRRLVASRPYLSDFLAQGLAQALAARPRPLKLAKPAPLAAPSSLHNLWLDTCDLFVLESDFWWHQGDYEQGIRCQQTSVFYDPTNIEAFSNVAWLQWSLGKHGAAISTYRQALAANPRSWQANEELGLYYARHKQLQIGVEYLQRAADLGSPAVSRRALGHALENLGRFAEAQQVWEAILKLDPLDPIATRQLARLKGR